MLIYKHFLAFFVLLTLFTNTLKASYRIGIAKKDITGPIAEENLIGYGELSQVASGISTRLFAKAFVIEDHKRNPKKIVFVVCDLLFITESLTTEVIQTIKKFQAKGLLSNITYENLSLMATHTHSAPGGYSKFPLYGIGVGFNKKYLSHLAFSIVSAIHEAHEHYVLGSISYGSQRLEGASFNRSPEAFFSNKELSSLRSKLRQSPMADKLRSLDKDARTPFDQTNKYMTVLRFEDQTGIPLGLLSFFAVHPTSMSKRNTLISSDNKGIAAFFVEQEMTQRGFPHFIAAFANSELGDVSPHNFNSPRARKQKSTFYCELIRTVKNGKLQASKALEIFDSEELLPIKGTIDYEHNFIQMPNYNFQIPPPRPECCCRKTLSPGEIGYSFGAGALDGPTGIPGFYQGMTRNKSIQRIEGHPFWSLAHKILPPLFRVRVRKRLKNQNLSEQNVPLVSQQLSGQDTFEPLKLKEADDDPKKVLFSSEIFTPQIFPFQTLKIGQVTILSVPGELSTMAGFRLKSSLKRSSKAQQGPIIIAGLSNSYIGYITTRNEYDEQYYEAASTIYGPHSLSAFISIYSTQQAKMLSCGASSAKEELEKKQLTTLFEQQQYPPKLIQKLMLLKPKLGVILDSGPIGHILKAPKKVYKQGEACSFCFITGHPKNSYSITKASPSFFSIQRFNPSNRMWKEVANDKHPMTTFHWKRISVIGGTSYATIKWFIDPSVDPNFTEGNYRIIFRGDYKRKGVIHRFEKSTKSFKVISK